MSGNLSRTQVAAPSGPSGVADRFSKQLHDGGCSPPVARRPSIREISRPSALYATLSSRSRTDNNQFLMWICCEPGLKFAQCHKAKGSEGQSIRQCASKIRRLYVCTGIERGDRGAGPILGTISKIRGHGLDWLSSVPANPRSELRPEDRPALVALPAGRTECGSTPRETH